MRRHAPMLLVTAAFLAFSAATLDDYGMTWDEGVKMFDDDGYAEIVQRVEPYDPRVLHIPGYFYVVDTTRSLYAKLVSDLTGAHPVLVHHSFNVLLSTGCLVALYLLVLLVSGERRLATLSAVALALMPQFLGHSQNNPKDLPAALLFLCGALLFLWALERTGWRRGAAAAVVAGIALTTRVSALVVAPVLALWLWLRRRERLVAHRRGLALGALGAALVALASWPALWLRGTDVLATAAQRFETLAGLDVEVLYLGTLYPWTDTPWHFSLVHLLLTLPPAHLLCLAAAPFALARWRSEAPRKADALWLGALYAGGFFAADLAAPLHYDGVRHLLAALPGVALLAACGAEHLASRRALAPVPALLAAITILELASVHPYQTAYLNPIGVWLAGPHGERWIEVEYWGAPYKEGAEWINAHAEPDALVHFVIGGGQREGEDVAKYYLDRPVVRRGSFEQFRDPATPRYLMFITRLAWYDDFVRRVRAHYEPVYTVRRQRSVLLEIYSNRPETRR